MKFADKSGKKPSLTLNIISGNKHKGFGAGSIDLHNVSPIIIDQGKAHIDIGAMHAKSAIERGIRFSTNKADVPNGRQCWIVWVVVDHAAEGTFYKGMTVCEMWIDTEAKRGWKILSDHVNRMDQALKGYVLVKELDEASKKGLCHFLIHHQAEWWERTPADIKDQLLSGGQC